jgi:hypothetical protein
VSGRAVSPPAETPRVTRPLPEKPLDNYPAQELVLLSCRGTRDPFNPEPNRELARDQRSLQPGNAWRAPQSSGSFQTPGDRKEPRSGRRLGRLIPRFLSDPRRPKGTTIGSVPRNAWERSAAFVPRSSGRSSPESQWGSSVPQGLVVPFRRLATERNRLIGDEPRPFIARFLSDAGRLKGTTRSSLPRSVGERRPAPIPKQLLPERRRGIVLRQLLLVRRRDSSRSSFTQGACVAQWLTGRC